MAPNFFKCIGKFSSLSNARLKIAIQFAQFVCFLSGVKINIAMLNVNTLRSDNFDSLC